MSEHSQRLLRLLPHFDLFTSHIAWNCFSLEAKKSPSLAHSNHVPARRSQSATPALISSPKGEFGMATEAPMVPFVAPRWQYKDATFKTLKSLLQQRGVSLRNVRTREDAIVRLQKADTQPVVYEAFNNKQLNEFMQQRVLSRNKLTGKGGDSVIVLEGADKHLEFSRFLDLPPELRNHIYEYAFTNETPFSEALCRPRQPAITRVCRTLRAECLELFYASQTFVVHIIRYPYHERERLPIAAADRLWLKAIGTKNVSAIRAIIFAEFISEREIYPSQHLSFPLTQVRFDVLLRSATASKEVWHHWDRKAIGGIASLDSSIWGHMGESDPIIREGEILEALARRDRVQKFLTSICEGGEAGGSGMSIALMQRIGRKVLYTV